MTKPAGFAAYLCVTAAYWAFMLTDGALRMLVLLHFHTLGFSPVQLAYLFVFYELAGVITNLCAGWIAARFGLGATLYAGLLLQISALLALAQLDPNWGITASVIFVMLVQGASGVAKDLAKMSSKSAVKILAPDGEGRLFHWVAILTGSKNAIKGGGFLLGAALLAVVGFVPAVLALAAALGIVFVAIALGMPSGLPRGRSGVKFTEVWSKNHDINWLSLARLFLFGARDVWFVVGIPIYFYVVLSDGTEAGNRTAFFMIGSFMAVWTILYGIVQAATPRILRAAAKTHAQMSADATWWVLALALVPTTLAGVLWIWPDPSHALTAIIVAGLLLFGGIFAVNSALHSYLILSLTSAHRVTMDVGFYYMSNAAGRLLGTLLSGLSYQFGGLAMCLGTAALMLGLSAFAVSKLGKEGS